MNILVLVATDDEFQPYIDLFPAARFDSVYGFPCLTFKTFKHRLLIVKTGIGKVAASIAATSFLSLFKWNYVINAGLCGSLTKAKPGTLYFCEKFIEHDLDLSPLGQDRYQELPNLVVNPYTNLPPVQYGVLATGDQFLTRIPAALRATGANVCDMEGAALVRAVNTLSPSSDLLVLKMVSDGGSAEDYESNKVKLCTDLAKVVKNFITTVQK